MQFFHMLVFEWWTICMHSLKYANEFIFVVSVQRGHGLGSMEDISNGRLSMQKNERSIF